jgi:hypothetical protein
MKQNNEISRRNFVKTGIISSAAVAGVASLSSCTNNDEAWKKEDVFPVFKGNNYAPEDGVAGLLFSQVGYELGLPVRIIVRLPKKELLLENSACRLIRESGETAYASACEYWGSIWGSHWWTVDFNDINEAGEWAVEIHKGSDVLFRDTGLKVEKNILWNSTIEWSSVDMLERRKHFTKVGAGWQDAGSLWVESPKEFHLWISHSCLHEKSLLPGTPGYFW